MDARWASHIQDEKKKAEFLSLVQNSTIVLTRLLEIMELAQVGMERAEQSEDDFNNPNWALRQAYRGGKRSEHQRLRDLLGFIGR